MTAVKIAYCGDDCAQCPRFRLQIDSSRSEIEKVKSLLIRVGWMKEDFPFEKVPCSGCQDIEKCEYGVKECCIQSKIAHCGLCYQYPCAKINYALQITDINLVKFQSLLLGEEYAMFKRAFFEKRENLTRSL